MKKILFSLIVVLNILLLCGCSSLEYGRDDFLKYQSSPFRALADVELNGSSYTVEVSSDGNENGSVIFKEPKMLEGVSIEKNGSELYYVVGNMRLPLTDKKIGNASALIFGLFKMSDDNLTKVETTMQNGVKINTAEFENENGKVKLYVAVESGLPLRIEAMLDGSTLNVDIKKFENK